ncbi:MAG TPA: hypothetical protein V6D08_12420 [Candidatus Obscuribacterales bacterium]
MTPYLVLTAAAFFALLVCLIARPLELAPDVAMYLQCGQLILEGEVPYVDFVDTNLPIILYLNVIPAFVSAVTRLPAIAVLKVIVWMLVVISAMLTASILAKRTANRDYQFFGPLLFAFACANLMLTEDFGQREHIFVVCVLPLFFVRWLRYQGQEVNATQALIAGAFAAIGLWLKPYFPLLWLCLEIYFVLATRQLRQLTRPEVVSALSLAVIFLLAFSLGNPVGFSAYKERWLPIVVAGYSAYSKPLEIVVVGSFLYGLLPLVILSLLPVPWLHKKSSLIAPLAVLTGAGYLEAIYPRTMWFYHGIPAFTASFLLVCLNLKICLGFVFARFRKPSGKSDAYLQAGAFAVLSALLAFLFIDPWPRRWNAVGRQRLIGREYIARYSAAGDPVALLAVSDDYAYPAFIELNRRPGSRYLFLFIVPMLDYARATARESDMRRHWTAEEMQVVQDLRQDLQTRRPRLIFIEHSFVRPFLAQRGWFVDALVDYQKLESNAVFDVYRLKNGK